MKLFDLSGKSAMVTGCSRGIGFAMALALADAGADIVGVSKSLTEESTIGRQVRQLGRSFTPYRTDFADPAAVAELTARLATDGVEPDILVNNAGTIVRAPAHEHPDETWQHVLQVNLSAQFVLTRAIANGMLRRGHGKVVFTASMLSFQGGVLVPSYAAAKSGIAGLTRALANEWAGKGVNVNAIAPGYIETDNTAAIRADPERNEATLARIPAARWGRADDLAGAIVFLSSKASDYVHGSILAVDGGWLSR